MRFIQRSNDMDFNTYRHIFNVKYIPTKHKKLFWRQFNIFETYERWKQLCAFVENDYFSYIRRSINVFSMSLECYERQMNFETTIIFEVNASPCFKNASHSKLLNSNYSHCNAIIWKWKCLENVYHHDLVKSRPRSNRVRGAPKKTLLLLYAKQFFCIHKLWLYRCKHDKKRINTHL